MNQQLAAIRAEFIKNKHASIVWVTFIAFSLAPLFGSVFMIMMKDNGYEALSGAMKSKAMMFSVEANWNSFLGILSQAVGIGGILIFGFVASWLFGREYADGTAKDLMALPMSRTKIANAKFVYYFVWCLSLVIANLLLGLFLGFIIGIEGFHYQILITNLKTYFITTILILLLNTPIAFFALTGRGYLMPLGMVAILLVLAQIIGALGMGTYFPWAIPGIYSGGGGEDLKMQLDFYSYMIIVVTSILGYVGTVLWWKHADQK